MHAISRSAPRRRTIGDPRRRTRVGGRARRVRQQQQVVDAESSTTGTTATPETVSVTTGPRNTTPELAGNGQGVTATTVKIGVVFVDYKAIAQFIDFQRGDQQKIFQTFVDNINNTGGVAGGRKLVAVVQHLLPCGQRGPALGVHEVHRGRQGLRDDRCADRRERRRSALLHQATSLDPADARADPGA